MNPNDTVLCYFCRRSNTEVQKLIIPSGEKFGICDRCVVLCYEVLRKEGVDLTPQPQPKGEPPSN
jgi:ATP-dependent protease Clp ATPase subunit